LIGKEKEKKRATFEVVSRKRKEAASFIPPTWKNPKRERRTRKK
jgi:hypothetical protein